MDDVVAGAEGLAGVSGEVGFIVLEFVLVWVVVVDCVWVRIGFEAGLDRVDPGLVVG